MLKKVIAIYQGCFFNRILFAFVLLFSVTSLSSQTISWKFLEADIVTDGCTSISECQTSIQCYAMIYTPNVTGVITSYTTGFLINCIDGNNPIMTNSSCIMTDNSAEINGCNALDLVLVNSSGNSGTRMVIKDSPIFIHQVCFDIPDERMIVIEKDGATGLTVSIDSINGGGPQTDIPSFISKVITNISCPEQETLCGDTVSCSRNFGLDSLHLDFMGSGNSLVDGITNESIGPRVFSFDIYDEENNNCGVAGGEEDIEITIEIFNTRDVNSNGIIDALGGGENNILQGSNGLLGNIAMGTSMSNASSSGDFRGYKVSVDFASHLMIRADQLKVILSGINSTGSVYESSALLFNDQNGTSFGSASYIGLYNTNADLSGMCMETQTSSPWSTMGNGVFIAASTEVIDLSDPCNPMPSGIDGVNNNISVSAFDDTGIDANEVIGGFQFFVFAEDVSASLFLDDGSANNPDDGITGNAMTTANYLASSILSGFKIDGCVEFATSSLKEQRHSEFNIFPVPTKDRLVLITKSDVNIEEMHISIFDYSGKEQLVKQSLLNKGNVEIDIEHLQTGTYIIRFIIDNNVYTKSVIKI